MKIHKLIRGCTEYPVGQNIVENMPVIDQMGKVLKKFINDNYPSMSFVNLVCRGSSGAIISGLVAATLKKDSKRTIRIYHIKKEGEKAHGSGYLDDSLFADYSVVVVIDDFVDTGRTIDSIIEKIGENHFENQIHILCVTGKAKISAAAKKKFIHAIISK